MRKCSEMLHAQLHPLQTHVTSCQLPPFPRLLPRIAGAEPAADSCNQTKIWQRRHVRDAHAAVSDADVAN